MLNKIIDKLEKMSTSEFLNFVCDFFGEETLFDIVKNELKKKSDEELKEILSILNV